MLHMCHVFLRCVGGHGCYISHMYMFAMSTLKGSIEEVNAHAHVVARKIGLTCMDTHQNTFEVELFIRPGAGDSVIYGVKFHHGCS